MKKIIIITPIILLVIVFIFLLVIVSSSNNGQSNSVVAKAGLQANKPTSSQTASTLLSDSKNGVDLVIDNIKKENNQTIIDLSLNNHVYDLSPMDVGGGSSLAGVNPNSYKIINSGSGGHHLQAQMIFNGNLSGSLVIKLNDSLVFNFTI